MSEIVNRSEWDGKEGIDAGGGLERGRAPASPSGSPPPASAGDAGGGGSEAAGPVPGGPNPEPPSPAVEAADAPGGAPGEMPMSGVPPIAPGADAAFGPPHLSGRRTGAPRSLAKPPAEGVAPITPQQKLLILDTWQRSGLPVADFADLVGVSKFTLIAWKRRFEEEGPGGLMPRPKAGPNAQKLPEVTRRTILMLKESHPEWGCQRISDMLVRGPGLAASATTVAKVLRDAGYESEAVPTVPHPDARENNPDHVNRFERARPNQLWQSDLFTFVLKRQNRRVYLVAFLDDHSRFVVGYGLHASQSAPLVVEVLRAAITAYGLPQEVLTDNGAQYVTWRGKSAFARELEKQGIRHVVSAPRHPQTLGKVERFWGTLWRECLESAIFLDLTDARQRIGHFIDYYNFRRPHQGIEGLVPADRFFQMAPEIRKTLQDRVAANALELARHGLPREPFYVTGQVGGKTFSVHSEGERVILTQEGQTRREVDLVKPSSPPAEGPTTDGATSSQGMPAPLCPQGVVNSETPEPSDPEAPTSDPPPPGTSPLDQGLRDLAQTLNPPADREGGEA